MSSSYLLPTCVECYAGSRAEETPRAVWLGGARVEIREVVDRWYQGHQDPEMPAAEYLRVRTADGELRLLRHELSPHAWYLVVPEKTNRSPAW